MSSSYSAMTSDVKLWENHFKKMVSGEVKPSKYGVFIVEKRNTPRDMVNDSSTPGYKMVTPAAQAIEIAKSEVQHADEQPKDSAPITYFPSLGDSSDKQTPSTRAVKKRGRPPKPKGIPSIAVETGRKKKKTNEEFWKLY